jgi:hypothetical protein
MQKQYLGPIPARRPNCPILEALTSRGYDMCQKEKLENTDLDTLGVSHSHRSYIEHDFAGVSDSWLD